MSWGILEWGQFYTVFMIGLALGTDAFSLGIGMEMQGIRLRTIAKVSLTIGLFHVIMPMLGIVIGEFISAVVGNVATFIGGLILCFLGANMLWNAFFRGEEKEAPIYKTKGIGLILFSLSVSLDALSVGLSFGLFKVNVVLALAVFGILGTFASLVGLLLGRQAGSRLGGFGEVLGGTIIMVFGLKFLL